MPGAGGLRGDELLDEADFERFGIPRQHGGKYFYTRNVGLQNQSVLLVADSLAATPRELLDSNQLSAEGTVALADWDASDDGRYLAYGLASAGSDWLEWKVKDVATGRDLGDHVVHRELPREPTEEERGRSDDHARPDRSERVGREREGSRAEREQEQVGTSENRFQHGRVLSRSASLPNRPELVPLARRSRVAAPDRHRLPGRAVSLDVAPATDDRRIPFTGFESACVDRPAIRSIH